MLVGCGGGGSSDENSAPTTTGATLSINEDQAGTVTVSASDRDGDSLTVAITTAPTKGTAAISSGFTFSYTPTANQNGADQFSYQITDSHGATANGVVNVSIAAQPDAPTAPALALALALDEDTVGSVTITAADVDGEVLTATVNTPPAKGAVVVTGTNPFVLTYTPTANLNGADTFSYRVTDASGLSVTASVPVTIAPLPDAPVVVAGITTNEDTAAVGALAADPDGDAVTVTALTLPAHGTLVLTAAGGAFTYTPAANYFGPDSIEVQASDGVLTRTATVDLTVTSVNDVPVAVDENVAIAASGPQLVDVLLNDSDVENEALSVLIESPPPGATATVVANQVQVTPAAGTAGPTSLRYRVTDASGGSAVGTLHLVMGPASAVFYYTGTETSPDRRIRRYNFFTNVELHTPIPAGSRFHHFSVSADGNWLVYVTRNENPLRHRLWLRNLVDLAAPVQEIATGSNFFPNYLRLSPDGSLVAFNNSLASTATPAQSVVIDGSGIDIQHPTFTNDSRKLFYTVNYNGGGRVIYRAEVSAAGVISNRLQMTANYQVAEGLGIQFRLTPDETRIVSLGLMLPPPMTTLGIKQNAFVTTADGSMNDARLHPLLTTDTEGVAFLPDVTANSRFALFQGTLGGTTGLFRADLLAPGSASLVTTDSPYVGAHQAYGPDRVLIGQSLAPQQYRWFHASLDPLGSAVEFAVAGQPAPRQVVGARDGSAVVFDQGDRIYATFGGQFSSSTELAVLPADDPIPHSMRYSPDSSSAVVLGTAGTSALILNPKAPGWSDQLDPVPATSFGQLCVAFANSSGC